MKAGGKVVEELTVPFPEVEFQALLTQLATLKPDAVHAFFAGGGAVKNSVHKMPLPFDRFSYL